VLLGVVAEINDLDVVVSLPSNMVGRVPITEVSEPVSAAVERAAEADDAEDELDEDAADAAEGAAGDRSRGAEVPDLARLFSVGQVVRCAVVSKSAASEGRTQLQLSVRPDRTNANDLGQLLCPGYVRPAAQQRSPCPRASTAHGPWCLPVSASGGSFPAGCVGVRHLGRGPRLCDVAGHEGRHRLPAAVGHERRCVGGHRPKCAGALQL